MIEIIDILLYAATFVTLVIGTITDIKQREVPDWLNYSMISFALGSRIIYSMVAHNWNYLLYGVYGGILFLLVALVMFYSGQWGGGDSKTLIAIGALIGLNVDYNNILWSSVSSFLISLFVNILVIGAAYGLVYSIFVAVKNKKAFSREFSKVAGKNLREIKIILISFFVPAVLLFFFVSDIFRLLLTLLAAMLVLISFLFLFIKAVEKSCMFRQVKPSELTEGDWIAKDIFIAGKRITGPKDLGINEKQINQLVRFYRSRKIKKVLIKVGIPFIPSFLVAFITTFFAGNILLLFFSL